MSYTLGPYPSSITRARELVRRAVAGRAPAPVVDEAALLTSELVTNVVRHVDAPFTLDIDWDGQRLRVEVGDPDPRPPLRATDADRGFGLRIVDAVSLRWGVIPVLDGKVVWFEVGDRSR
jgi:anti-sigma regulatory factor (Ser/Thr protein kinase)